MSSLKKLKVAELRAELTKYNVDHKHLRYKAQLIDALSTYLSSNNTNNNTDNNNNNDAEKKKSKKRKVTDTFKKAVKPVTEVIKSGSSIPVDKECDIKDKVHVYQNFDALLNQSNASRNNNKFYIIQVLKADSRDDYYCFQRWGRVGYRGQMKLLGPTSLSSAISAFKGKFTQKTKNKWENRENFTTYDKKYTLIERDFNVDDNDDNDNDNDDETTSKKVKLEVPDSKLSEPVKDLVSMIFDVEAFKARMIELNYDAERMPLGKIGEKTIRQAYAVLKKLSDVISDNGKKRKQANNLKRDAIENLTNEFYTLIPHDFGFRRPPIIDNMQVVKAKLEMLEALQDLEVTTNIIDNQKHEKNPIDEYYDSLHCDVEEIHSNSDEYKLIEQYLQNTHGHTHSYYDLEIKQVYRVNRGEYERNFRKDDPNRRLLWHGSRVENFVGILSQGLRIAPPEAPVTGYMFGKGVYFADSCSKSANYCRPNNDNEGIMLLCEVALGNMNEKYAADYYASNLPANKHSTFGMGRTEPNPSEMIKLKDGVQVPIGKMVDSNRDNCSLQYNEFIVYDTSRIKMRYALKLKFNYRY